MTYKEYKNMTQEEYNNLPIFYAFSDSQFEKAMNERGLTVNDTDKIYKLGGTGGFYLKKDAEIIRAYFNKEDQLPKLMADFSFAREAFLYELANHEYAINWEGDYDVCSCFGKCNFDEEKSWREYLVEMGYGETTIRAFKTAVEEYMTNANNW